METGVELMNMEAGVEKLRSREDSTELAALCVAEPTWGISLGAKLFMQLAVPRLREHYIAYRVRWSTSPNAFPEVLEIPWRAMRQRILGNTCVYQTW